MLHDRSFHIQPLKTLPEIVNEQLTSQVKYLATRPNAHHGDRLFFTLPVIIQCVLTEQDDTGLAHGDQHFFPEVEAEMRRRLLG